MLHRIRSAVVSPSTNGKKLERNARAGSFQVYELLAAFLHCLSITRTWWITMMQPSFTRQKVQNLVRDTRTVQIQEILKRLMAFCRHPPTGYLGTLEL